VSQPSTLKEQLAASGVSADKADSFTEVWQSSQKQIIDSLKQRLTKPQQVETIIIYLN
jgi:hypothetical protein